MFDDGYNPVYRRMETKQILFQINSNYADRFNTANVRWSFNEPHE